MPEYAKKDVNVKVVHLEPESQRVAKARIARLPAAVHAVHEKGKHLIAEKLKVFFDRADDSLFELADKAGTNNEQNIYFDSMREVRVQRRGFEKRFSLAIDDAFAELAAPASSESVPTLEDSLSADALSLVQNDELEEMVAIDSSVKRANSEYAESIQHICLRLDSQVPVKVFEKNNPLGPNILANAFMAQARKLDVDIKAKLVLFKLFDKAVMQSLGKVYEQINQTLIDHSVLPSLTSAPKRSAAASAAASFRQGHPPVAAAGNPEVAEALKTLLGSQTNAQQTVMNEVAQLLSLAQQSSVSLSQFQGGVSGVSLIEEMCRQRGVAADIGTTDREVINLVDMLFKFILEDRNLSEPMKALIARMQIPIIKVAILDKSFFAKGGHAARRLLNEIATAALGWQSNGDDRSDPLYRKIESIVASLLSSFDTDVSIFSDLLADFTSFIQKERRRAEIIEKRTLDAEDGKARAEVARTIVGIEIELRTIDQKLPPVVTELVNGPWNNVMFVTYLKHGHKASEWESVLGTLDDLVWSAKVPTSDTHRKELIRLVPELLKRLRAGLDSISFNPFQMSEMFKELEDVHLACIRGKIVAPEAEKTPGEIPLPKETSAPTQAAKPVPRREPLPKIPAANEPVVKPLEDKRVPDSTPPTPVSRPAPVAETVSKPEPVVPMADDSPFMQQVDTFVQGAWFEMTDDTGAVSRCRLAAIIKPTGKFIFVNRNGMKVAEKARQELAEALQQNKLRALDNSMLFDRALETVVSSLRKPQE